MDLLARRWGILRVSAKLCGVAFVAATAAVKLAQAGQHTGRLDVCLALALGAVLAVVVFPAPAVPLGRIGWPVMQWLHRQRAQLQTQLRAYLRALQEPVHHGATLVGTLTAVAAVVAVMAVALSTGLLESSAVPLGQFLAPLVAHCLATIWLTVLCTTSSRAVPFVLFMFVVLLVTAMLHGVAVAVGRCVGGDVAVDGFAVMAAVLTSFAITAGVLVWQLAEKVVMVPVWGLGLTDLMCMELGMDEEGRPPPFVRVQDPIGPAQGVVAQVWLTNWLWEGFVADVAVANAPLAPVAGPAEAHTPPLPPALPAHYPSARRVRKTRRRTRQRQDRVPEDACCVCLESLKWTSARPEVARLVCSHHLHTSCLEVMQSRFPKCPLCLCPVGVRYCVAMAPPSVPVVPFA
jgi:hypothetical protein